MHTGFYEGNLMEKTQLGRPRHRWEHNIKTGVNEVGLRGMGWIDLAQDRQRWRALVDVVTNFQVP